MYKHIVYTLFIAIFIIGCKEPEPEVIVEPPPPPTAQVLALKVYNDLNLKGQVPSAKNVISDAVVTRMEGELKRHKDALSREVNGEDALALIRHAIDTRIKECEETAAWTQVLALIRMHLVLKPGSKKHIIIQDRAIVQLKKPVVSIKGFLTDNKTKRKKALLDFFIPLENVTYSETMLQGEQLHGLRFEKVIGDDQGIIFFYIDADERFEVFMGSSTL